MPPRYDEPRVQAWDKRMEWPLTVAAAIFLAAYAWPILQPHLHGAARRACHVANWVTWAVFVVDYVTRVALARHRPAFVVRHLLDLAVVALPIFRPLRLLRLLLLLKTFNRQAAQSFRGRIAAYVVGSTVILLLCASLAVLQAERGHQHANIATFGEALWWSFVTITTVGYGDYYPVTTAGRFVAVALMLGGVALIGLVTATLATWFVDRVRDIEETATEEQEDDTGALRSEIAELRREIAELRGALIR